MYTITSHNKCLSYEDIQEILDNQLESKDLFSEEEVQETKDLLDEIREGDYLIHEDNIQDYIKYDIQRCSNIEGWLLYYIDWDSLVSDSLMDYTVTEYKDETYYIR